LFASAVLDHVEVEAVSVFSTCLRLENRFDYFAGFALFSHLFKPSGAFLPFLSIVLPTASMHLLLECLYLSVTVLDGEVLLHPPLWTFASAVENNVYILLGTSKTMCTRLKCG
jgi:hypothetical protein